MLYLFYIEISEAESLSVRRRNQWMGNSTNKEHNMCSNRAKSGRKTVVIEIEGGSLYSEIAVVNQVK